MSRDGAHVQGDERRHIEGAVGLQQQTRQAFSHRRDGAIEHGAKQAELVGEVVMNHRRRRAGRRRDLPRRHALEAVLEKQLAGRIEQRAANVLIRAHDGSASAPDAFATSNGERHADIKHLFK
jgi:hypothetical protein